MLHNGHRHLQPVGGKNITGRKQSLSKGTKVKGHGYIKWSLLLPSMLSWASYLTVLSLCVLICKIRIILAPFHTAVAKISKCLPECQIQSKTTINAYKQSVIRDRKQNSG